MSLLVLGAMRLETVLSDGQILASRVATFYFNVLGCTLVAAGCSNEDLIRALHFSVPTGFLHLIQSMGSSDFVQIIITTGRAVDQAVSRRLYTAMAQVG
jgi:hypothetical protein